MVVCSSLLGLLLPCLLIAQSSVDVQQAFLDLGNDGVLMCVSAHADYEDGATLAYYRMKYGVKTYSVFLTRGEGGQSEKGPELYEELGVLRTAETQAAGKIHSDIERGFIRAEIYSFEELMSAGSVVKAREAGKLRTEGKEYVMRDGDVVHFRFAV